ncbi:MAG TPA: integrase arm-type DNA-binding domain-containing protein [Candidatus Binataceae bacterium]|nr:integrase arm-type DNA-binding domain-containing protein [Candidatus Binataceae bacterium]
MLSDTAIRRTKPKEKASKLFDGHGLYLLIAPTGGKWWRLKYRFSSKEKLLALGTYPEVSLKEARERCHEVRKKLAAGIDPGAERKEAKAAAKAQATESFEAVAREWFDKFSRSWVPEHAAIVMRRLEANVFPWLGVRPIGEITAPEVLTVLRRIEARGALEVAHRVKQVVGQVFRYAVATGRAQRDPTGDLRGALPPPPEKHHAALTKPADVANLMRAIDGYKGSFIVRCALRFSALTFVRPGELRKAEWADLDLDNATWLIPAARMKMKRDHLVPLSRQAVEVLRELNPLTGSGRYVFPGARAAGRPMSENAITAALRYMGYERGQMTAHGFRTLASTLLNEMGWSADAIERQLAHAERDGVRAAYNRAEYLAERRRMMQAWADYLDGLITTGATVVPFRASA